MCEVTCPLTSRTIKTECPVTTCMYFSRNVLGRCRYSKMNPAGYEGAERVELASSMFCIPKDEVEDGIKSVKAVLAANAYFNFLFGKDVLDARRAEMLDATNSGHRFSQWPGAKHHDFARIRASLELLNSRMR